MGTKKLIKMKCIGLTVAFMALVLGVSAQRLTVNVSGIRSNVGKVMVGIGDFKENPAGMTGQLLAADTTGVRFEFDSLPMGENHIYVIHVEQSDFRPEMLSRFMMSAMSQDNSQRGIGEIPKVGLGVDRSGSWEPLVSDGKGVVDFEIKYINFKK